MEGGRIGVGRGQYVAALGAMLVLFASGCTASTSTSDSADETRTTGASGSTVPASALLPPAETCGGIGGQTAWLDVAGVGRIQTATIGRGDNVAILLHQASSVGLCGFTDYAQRLAEQGVRSVLLNQCGYGQSACDAEAVADVAGSWPKVTAAAVEQARQAGATRITLVGASAGGTLAVVAAAQDPEIDAIVDLSGPITYQGLDAGVAAPSVGQQVLVLTAPEDPAGPTPDEAQALVAKMPPGDKRVLVAADQPGGHGWALLGRTDQWGPLADSVQQVVLGD